MPVGARIARPLLEFVQNFGFAHLLFIRIKTEKEEHSALNVKTVQKINVNDYMAGQDFWQLGEIAKYRTRALSQLDRYLKYLTRIQASQEYINTISEIEKRVFDLTIKAKDLKQIKFKL